MSKVIVYTANDSGIDGMDKTKCLYAALSENDLDSMIQQDRSKAWRTKGEIVVDLEAARKTALRKLDGIDRLALNLPSWLEM